MKIVMMSIGLFAVLSTSSVYAQENADADPVKKPKVIYKEQNINFEGLSLEGELNTPSEFYFQNRNQERFDSLTKRRSNFRREMLRDAVQSN